MATATNHRIIIEQGSDFRINLQISEDGLTPKDLTTHAASGAIEMVIKYKDVTTGDIVVQDTVAGVFVEDTPASGTYVNGYCEVVIDEAVTATYPTRLLANIDPFATEYMYNYSIELIEDTVTSAGKDNLRILRGKCAVRA